jgi:histidinol phosphatase-like PHP family hydrolase
MSEPAPTATAGGAPAPRWRPRDCHAHSTWSDGALDPERVVARARERGVLPSVTDHLSGDVSAAVSSVEQVRRYIDALDWLAADVPELGRGGEFCWHDRLWRDLPPELWRRFTHTVGSLHAIGLPDDLARGLAAAGGGYRAGTLGVGVHMFQRRWPEGLDVDAYMDAHVASLERFAREMPVDILAHPTLLPLPIRTRPLEELWTEEREERAVAALGGAGIAFEISNRYRPHERFVRRAVDAGVRISLGSDGHTDAQVADVAWPLALARSLGVRDEELYDPFSHGRRGRD